MVLADGGLLAVNSPEGIGGDREKVMAESAFGQVAMPLDRVAGIVLELPAVPLSRDRLLDQVAKAQGVSDSLLLLNGDEVRGNVRAIKDQKVSIDTGAAVLEIAFARIRAIVFNPALTRRGAPSGLYAWAGFSDGSRLLASEMSLDDKSLHVKLPGGQTLAATPEDLVFLQPIAGRATYLSDLPVATYKHIPFLDLSWPFHTDRNVCGGMFRAAGRLYLKGIGMHSTSRLKYALSASYRRFDAELAVDETAGERGSVRFRVFVDGQVKYTSPIVRGGSPPVPIQVDVSGAKQLDLVVDYADRGDELDHADWLNARLVR